MTFFIIGLGLADEQDITVKGLNAVKSCQKIYLESYTSILMIQKERLVNISIMILGNFLWETSHHR